MKSDAGSEPESAAPVNLEGQQYVDARSYVMFEISLSKPLIPKRPPEELARKVAEYIPPRPLFPKRTDGAQRVRLFMKQNSIFSVILIMLFSYKKYYKLFCVNNLYEKVFFDQFFLAEEKKDNTC